jgi:serine/threonine protein kinase
MWLSSLRGAVNVAVKTLKEGSGEEDRVKFLQEAAIMGQFKHPNVVEMYGVVTQGEPVSFGTRPVLIKRAPYFHKQV